MEQKEIIERILQTCSPEIKDFMMETVVRNECKNPWAWMGSKELEFHDVEYKRYELEKDPLETIRKWESIIAAKAPNKKTIE